MDHTLTRSNLEHHFPILFGMLKEQFMAEGARLERERHAGVRAQCLPGCEALIDKLSLDGKTTPGEAAIAVMVTQRQHLEANRLAFD